MFSSTLLTDRAEEKAISEFLGCSLWLDESSALSSIQASSSTATDSERQFNNEVIKKS
jgi:hypothetical protein